jgi:hypothetical protein
MRPRRDAPPDLSSASYQGHTLDAGFCHSFAVQAMRAYYNAEPPTVQRETMARISRLIAERPQSYLARHWRAMYLDAGVVPAPRLLRLLGIAQRKEVRTEG